MKVVQINTSDSYSGGAIASYRLHQGLLAQGVDSRLLLGQARESGERVAVIPRNQTWENLLGRVTRPLGLNYVNLTSTFSLPGHPFYQSADLLNFHNLHGGYFNYLALPKLTETRPAIYTLHDMWSFTGHCVYSLDCDRWRRGCGQCPYPHTYPEVQRDATQLELRLKEWVYGRSNLVIVTLSHWLTELAQASILNCFPIHHIPNGIDPTVYQPLDPELCRAVLGIPSGKYVLLTGAHNFADPRKGGAFLLQALQRLPATLKAEMVLLTLGDGNLSTRVDLGLTAVNLGYVSSDRLKSVIFSAADLFVFPTRADNLPLMIQESMACGTPILSFKVGGVPDLVRPGQTGYLVEFANVEDFSSKIIELLENSTLRQNMGQQCRAITLAEYSLELQVQRYIKLYNEALKQRHD